MATSRPMGPSTKAPLICPRSAILAMMAASTVGWTLGSTCSEAAMRATLGLATPRAWATSTQ